MAAIALVPAAAAMAAIVLFDVTVRLIPRRLCWVVAASGIVFQVGCCGIEGVVFGAFCATAVSVASRLAARVARAQAAGPAIGGGDECCMAALALATGFGAPAGMMACFLAAVLSALFRRVRARLLPGEAFAFAPFLGIWFAVGVLAALA